MNLTEDELWSWVRSVLSQGAAIRSDYMAGLYMSYEHYRARLDCAASERVDELWARLTETNSDYPSAATSNQTETPN